MYFRRGVPCIFSENVRKIKRDFQNLLKIFTGSTLTYFPKSLQFPRKYPKTTLFIFPKRGPLPIVLLHSNVDSFMWTLVWWWKILNNFFLNYCFLNILFLTSPDGDLDPWSCFHLGVEQKNYLLKSVSRRKDRPLGKRCPSKYESSRCFGYLP